MPRGHNSSRRTLEGKQGLTSVYVAVVCPRAKMPCSHRHVASQKRSYPAATLHSCCYCKLYAAKMLWTQVECRPHLVRRRRVERRHLEARIRGLLPATQPGAC